MASIRRPERIGKKKAWNHWDPGSDRSNLSRCIWNSPLPHKKNVNSNLSKKRAQERLEFFTRPSQLMKHAVLSLHLYTLFTRARNRQSFLMIPCTYADVGE